MEYVVGYNAIGYLEQKIRSSSKESSDDDDDGVGEEDGDGDDLTDKVVDDDVLLPGDHVALLLSACSHPAVSVRPEHGRIKQLVQSGSHDIPSHFLKCS